MNALLKQKVSITSRKPQTTRHRILGINTRETAQVIYIDTPGMHIKGKNALNRYMNRTADLALYDVDVILFMVTACQWPEENEWILKKLTKVDTPIFLLINKVDRLKNKNTLLPFIDTIKSKANFAHIIPISAKNKTNLDKLEATIINYLPKAPFQYGEDDLTDRSVRFMVAELIREKLFRESGEELPYTTSVEIEEFVESEKICRISALITVEKENHKKMFIGRKGEKLKTIGTKARKDIEKLLEQKVFLRLWIKVKSGWSDDERALKTLGYSD